MLNAPVFELLVVGWPYGSLDAPTLASPHAAFGAVACDSLDAAAEAAASRHFDAVLACVPAAQLDALSRWPALAGIVEASAVVVACTGTPGVGASLALVAAGVQDVVPLGASPEPADLSRVLRFAIERHARERAARKATSTDLLTGLPNQMQLIEHMSQLLALREREPVPMVVLSLRLDGLARAEAQLGREAANALRRKIAVRLRAAMRAGDVVASTAVDHFAVLLPRVQAADDGARVAEKLTAALRVPLGIAGRQIGVGVAVGIAQYPRDGKEAAQLLRVASDMAARAPAALADTPAAHRNPGAEAANDD